MNEEEFLKSEKNLFDLKKLNDGKYTISDFEFKLELNKDGIVIFTTTEEFLEPIEKEMKNKKVSTIYQALEDVTKLYDRLMDDENEESPLYKGQDVFELENDNNDIKFIDRTRYSKDQFNNDIIFNILEFLSFYDLCRFSRVSKNWLKLTDSDLLWERLLKVYKYEVVENLSIKKSFQESHDGLVKKIISLSDCYTINKNTVTKNQKGFGIFHLPFFKIREQKKPIRLEVKGMDSSFFCNGWFQIVCGNGNVLSQTNFYCLSGTDILGSVISSDDIKNLDVKEIIFDFKKMEIEIPKGILKYKMDEYQYSQDTATIAVNFGSSISDTVNMSVTFNLIV